MKNEKESLYQEAEELESRYKAKALYQEKNGTAEEGLLGSVQTLFEQLYQYDTGNPNYGVGERRKAAQAVASASVLSQLFPEDVRPSVQTLSKLDAVETYIRSSDKERVEALVLVRFSTSIAGSQEIKGSYLYKVSYSWSEQLLVSVIPLGNATFLTE